MSEKTNNTIVNLDDDPDFNAILKVVLKREGYQLFSATTPEKFAQLVKELKPALCLIDLNLDIGQGAGFTFLQAMRNKMGLEIPIFIVSRRSSREDISRALELGANDFITKPIDDTFVIQKVNQYLKNPEIRLLPYFKISEKDWPCEVSFDLNIAEVSEFGITLIGPQFLSKGTYLELSGTFLKELTGKDQALKCTIHNSWINEENGRYMSFFEFDANDNSLLSNVRSYILANYEEAPNETKTE